MTRTIAALLLFPWLAVGCATAPKGYDPAIMQSLEVDLPPLPDMLADECEMSYPLIPGQRPECVDDDGLAYCRATAIPRSRVFDLLRSEELAPAYRDKLDLERAERLLDLANYDATIREWEKAWKRERRTSDVIKIALPVAGGVAFGGGLLIGFIAADLAD